jgi:hypothetical protein
VSGTLSQIRWKRLIVLRVRWRSDGDEREDERSDLHDQAGINERAKAAAAAYGPHSAANFSAITRFTRA